MSVLATLIGIILVSDFELFRLTGLTMAMMLLLVSGQMSVIRHRQLGSRAVCVSLFYVIDTCSIGSRAQPGG